MIAIREQKVGQNAVVGWVTLESPRTLNALTLSMVETLHEQLSLWAQRPDVVCVVMIGEGKAFCAGGDVRRMRQGILDGDDYCDRFFASEYRLDYAIHTYPKPLLVWGHGVVMGGGLGLMLGASHRVVTPSTRMAMPEVSIGLYPDVGASYFLSRLPRGLGLFMSISACEWNGADAVNLGFADYLLQDTARALLEGRLAQTAWTTAMNENRYLLTKVLQGLDQAEQATHMMHDSEVLARACAGTLQEALKRLATAPITAPWFLKALENMYHASPVSLCLAAEQLQRVHGLSLAEVFRQDWNLSAQCARQPDFPEGVRAQLVDKDKRPQWSFSSVSEVRDSVIEAYFHCPLAIHPLLDL